MSSFDSLPIRPDLRGLEPYGAPQLNVPIQLNVNENTYGIPEAAALEIVEALAREVITLNRYPDREFLGLRSQLAGFLGFGLEAQQVWAANGSNEVLLQIFQAFGGPGGKSVTFGPTYSMYTNIARTSLTPHSEFPRNPGFSLEPEYVSEILSRENPTIAIICNPNNPTGTSVSLEVIKSAYEAFDGILVIDEAYAEFSSQLSALSLLPGRNRLVVSRTMSKAFAFAGARVGYVAADPAIIDALRIVRLPYHLSALTQAAASAALKNSQLMLNNVERIKQERNKIAADLEALGLTVFSSDANFLLVGGIEHPEQVFQNLLDQGVIVRNVGLPNTLRVTAGTEIENKLLIEAFRVALS